MDKASLLMALKSEIERSTGCTDPGAVCLAVARAGRELGARPEHVAVTVSPNVFKNGINVGVPGTGLRGLPIAAALGAVLRENEPGLAMLEEASPADVEEAIGLVNDRRVEVSYAETPDTLYIEASVSAGSHSARAVIRGSYTHIAEVMVDGRIVFEAESAAAGPVKVQLRDYPLKELFDAVEAMSVPELAFLAEAAAMNLRAARAGLGSPANALGAALDRCPKSLPAPYAAMARAQLLTAAAAEARMAGMQVPVMAISGSGNHGITSFLGVLAVAEVLGADEEQTRKALAVSSTVTVASKEHSARLSAFCGCAVSAATGVAAGTVYLLGGSQAEMARAMHSVIGTLAGMVCDGAKESCAFKLSSAAALAVQFGYLAMEGAYIKEGMGIVGSSIEQTFANLGQLNNPGMVTADRLILHMISGDHKPSE